MSVLVGKKAPDFTSPAVMPNNIIEDNFNFHQYIKGKIGILFFWPADFTFVCPTEIIAFDHRLNEIEKRGAKLVGCSRDSQFVHFAWKNTPIKQGGIGNIKFPMVADVRGKIMQDYDVESPSYIPFRATFLIDQEGKVVHQVVNDLPLGRNIDELIRMIDALKFVQENGEVCPANWQKGDEGMKPTQEGVAKYLEKNANKL